MRDLRYISLETFEFRNSLMCDPIWVILIKALLIIKTYYE